jgi:hypothetical protein
LIKPQNEHANSHIIGELLMVIIILMLAVLVLLMFQFPDFFLHPFLIPAFIEIRGVYHTNEQGAMNLDSRVILFNNGTDSFENDNLKAVFYRNGEKLSCTINTLNGYNFIPTHHMGIQTMGGTGCQGTLWSPHQKIALDFTDGTFRPGDRVTVDIVRKPDILLSSYSYNA